MTIFYNNKQKNGFSLVELMVVVAIIGILASIAVPSFKEFKFRAEKAEVRSNLAAFHQSSKGTYINYGFYPGNLPATGFYPEGLLRYEYTGQDNINNTCGMDNLPQIGAGCEDTCITTGEGATTASGCTTATWQDEYPTHFIHPSFKFAQEGVLLPITTTQNSYVVIGCRGRNNGIHTSTSSSGVSVVSTYTAQRWNCWSMDENKVLTELF